MTQDTMTDSEKSYQEEVCWAEYDYFANDWEYDFWRKVHRCEAFPATLKSYFRNDPVADYEELFAEEED